MPQRIHKLDNFRAVLIMLVVFGHACQFLIFPSNQTGFLLIYTFHMPAFVFLTGICSKPGNPKRVVTRFLLPYVVFQVAYFIFLRLWIDPETTFSLLKPIRQLWYLLSVAIWKSLLPLFDTERKAKRILFVIGSVVIALAVGYLKEIARTLSLSRTFIFFPFFLSGYYLKDVLTQPRGLCTKRNAKLFSGLLLAASVLVLLLLQDKINNGWLYGLMPYDDEGYNPLWRGLILLLAALMSGSLFVLMPERKIPLLTTLGTRTMPIFIFHMAVMLLLSEYRTAIPQQAWFALLVSALCVAVFSLPPFVWLTSPITSWRARCARKTRTRP